MSNTLAIVVMTILAASAIGAFIRLLRGPTLADRVVSFDLSGIIVVGLFVVASAVTGEEAFLDVAMVLALVSFVGTIAYARYIEREQES